MLKKMVVSTTLALGLLALCSTAQAGLITGSISFTGVMTRMATVDPPGPAGNTLAFTSVGVPLLPTGAFAPIGTVAPGATSFSTIMLDPTGALIAPVALWSYGAYSFMLNSLQRTVNGSVWSYSGVGIVSIGGGGYDPTPASFLLTTQAGSTSTFSATVDTVPEPATLGLLGMGLLGLATRARRRRE